jgi:hypothetical protein
MIFRLILDDSDAKRLLYRVGCLKRIKLRLVDYLAFLAHFSLSQHPDHLLLFYEFSCLPFSEFAEHLAVLTIILFQLKLF